jgi:membrane fusion protein (multidrug efflux system)
MALQWRAAMSAMGRRPVVLAALAGLALAAIIFLLTYGLSGSDGTDRAQPPRTPPAPEVGILVVQPAEIPFPQEYAGRVSGFRDVEIRPLVGGLLLKREFEEGATVKQGQVLFRIDPATYEVALQRGEAQLLQGEATLREAEENLKRAEELVRRGAGTEQRRDEARSQRDQALAAVKLAQAEIASAKLNLGYTVVTAPVSGVTALQSPPVGTLIQAQTTLLTTITQLDPAYVVFSFTDEEGLAFRELNEKRAKPITESDLTVDLQIGNARAYPREGKLDTAAQRVDAQTGTIQARAVFPNPDGVLLPGQFVRVRIRGITLPDAIVVPSQSVSQGPQGPFVYLVGANGVAEERPVRLGPELPNGWVIRGGLKGGERVVVDGVIRVRQGAAVRVRP